MTPQIVTDSDGKEMEVPTEEEIAQREKDAAERATKEAEKAYEETQEKFDEQKKEKEKEVTELKEELDTIQDKVKNLGNLRFKTDKQEEEKKESEKKMAELQEQLEKKQETITEFVVGGARNKYIKIASGGDEEMAKAIRINYDRIAGEETNEEAIKNKIKEAFVITQTQMDKDPSTDVLNDAFANSGGGKVVKEKKTGGLTEEAKDMGKRSMNITDEDIEKYGDK